MYLLDYLFEERGEKERCDVERFQIIGLMVVILMFYSRVVSVVLVLSGVGMGMEFRDKKFVEVKCQQRDTI